MMWRDALIFVGIWTAFAVIAAGAWMIFYPDDGDEDE